MTSKRKPAAAQASAAKALAERTEELIREGRLDGYVTSLSQYPRPDHIETLRHGESDEAVERVSAWSRI